MTSPTLSQLADIGAKAAFDCGSSIDPAFVAVSATHILYRGDTKAREAFVKAVLDAVGYKFPVDPEREAFERWLARQGDDNKPDLFTVWQAGKASHTTTEPAKPAPATFEAHGFTWFKHTPGDPCPVADDVLVHITISNGSASGNPNVAKIYTWGKMTGFKEAEIIGWRHA